jgi:hypothetical protein
MRWVAYAACTGRIRLLLKYFIPEVCAFHKTEEFLEQHSDYELVKLDFSPTNYQTQCRPVITL